MQESLENMVEFSLMMSHSCDPGCVKILSITTPCGVPGSDIAAPAQRPSSIKQATIIPFPVRG